METGCQANEAGSRRNVLDTHALRLLIEKDIAKYVSRINHLTLDRSVSFVRELIPSLSLAFHSLACHRASFLERLVLSL